VALRHQVRSEADLRELGINKLVHCKKVFSALQRVELELPPAHPVLHNYLYALLEFDSLEDEQLLAYATMFSEQMGLTRYDELGLVEEADIQSMDLLEGHMVALSLARRFFDEPLPRDAPPEPEPARASQPVARPAPAPVPVVAAEEEEEDDPQLRQAVVVGELKTIMMSMKNKHKVAQEKQRQQLVQQAAQEEAEAQAQRAAEVRPPRERVPLTT
jgi:hypothetical protein